MPWRSRLLARSIATALAVVVCGGALNWGHLGGDDPEDSLLLVLHDHAAHRIGATPSQSSSPIEHCYLCHSLRLLHSMLSARGAGVIRTVQSTPFRQFDGLVAFSIVGTARSSRAPPALSL